MQVNRYISDDYKQINFETLGVVICTKEVSGTVSAMGFSGKRSKPDFNYRFNSIEQRTIYIDKYMNNIVRITQEKLARRESRKVFKHSLKVGDILVNSWGWEQTNIDFYQVVEIVSDKTVKIREICHRQVRGLSGMSSEVMPSPDSFLKNSEAILKRVISGCAGADIVNIEGHYASIWNGKPQYKSWYA